MIIRINSSDSGNSVAIGGLVASCSLNRILFTSQHPLRESILYVRTWFIVRLKFLSLIYVSDSVNIRDVDFVACLKISLEFVVIAIVYKNNLLSLGLCISL